MSCMAPLIPVVTLFKAIGTGAPGGAQGDSQLCQGSSSAANTRLALSDPEEPIHLESALGAAH